MIVNCTDSHFSIAEIGGFRDFYLSNHSAIAGFVKGYIPMRQVGEDITQESFLKLFNSREQFTSKNDARAWLYIVARNLCLDHLRHQRFRAGELPENFASDNFFLDEITRQESLLALRGAIAKLPTQTRRVAELTADGKSNAEIAEEMEISLNSVKTLKKEAYKKLRNTLEHQYLPLLTLLFMS